MRSLAPIIPHLAEDAMFHRTLSNQGRSLGQRSCLTTLHHTLEVLMWSCAPIIHYLAEDAMFHGTLSNQGNKVKGHVRQSYITSWRS